MRIVFTSDLHGSAGLYAQLDELLRAATPDVLVLGGDLFTDVDRGQPLSPQITEQEREFAERIAGWRATRPSLAVALLLGNHDLTAMLVRLQARAARGEFAILNEREVWRHGGLNWLGYAPAPPSPHWAKDFERLDLPGDDVPADFAGVLWDPVRDVLTPTPNAVSFHGRPSIADELAQAPTPADPWIFVAHAPPYDSGLDRLPHIAVPIGSRAVRQFIETRQPLVSLHGHVHESPAVSHKYAAQIGPTLSINPGQSATRLHAVVFDAEQPAATLRHTVRT